MAKMARVIDELREQVGKGRKERDWSLLLRTHARRKARLLSGFSPDKTPLNSSVWESVLWSAVDTLT